MDVYGFVSRLLVLSLLVAAVLFAVERGRTPDAAPPAAELLPAAAVAEPAAGRFANVRVSTANGASLAQARLLVNGEPRGSFAVGTLLVRVYDGDILTLDCRAYGREVEFRVEVLSAGVERRYLPERFTCGGEVKDIGFVVMP